MTCIMKNKASLYQGLNVLLATKDDLGHVLNLEGGVGALAGKISRAGGLIIVDGMTLEAGLDGQVVLNGSKTSRGGV